MRLQAGSAFARLDEPEGSLTQGGGALQSFPMKSTVLISELSANPSAVIARAEAEGMVPISRAGRTVAFVVGREKLAAILETLELQRDPELMRLVTQDQAGDLEMRPLE